MPVIVIHDYYQEVRGVGVVRDSTWGGVSGIS